MEMSEFHNFNHTKIGARSQWIIGIDEVGRGPLAGPVVVAGVKINSKLKNQNAKFWKGIKDSKKLTPKQREEWFLVLTSNPQITWATAQVLPQTIDRINIARAADLGVRRVYRKLSTDQNGRLRIVMDGGLKLPQYIPHEVIIKGDERVPIIAAASIIAKVIRDRIMLQLHKKFPQYGFDRHKGYGTKLHRESIVMYGFTPVHRFSFCSSINPNE